MYNADQLQAARRNQVETLLGLSGKAFEGIERILELNLRTTKAVIEQTSQAALAAVSSRDVPSLVEVQAAAAKPATDSASAYGRDLLEIVTSTGADMSRLAEASASESKRRILAAFEGVSAQAQTTVQNALVTVPPAIDEAKRVAETLESAAAEGAAAAEAAAETTVTAAAAATVKNVQGGPKTRRNTV